MKGTSLAGSTKELLAYANSQMSGYECEYRRLKKSIGNLEFALQATGFAFETAIFAGVSAATMGLATYFSTFRLAQGAGNMMAGGSRTAALAVQATPTPTKVIALDAAVRVLAGLASGTTVRLTQAQIAQALTGAACRVAAAPIVGGVAICVRHTLYGGTIDKKFVEEELKSALVMCVVFAWLSYPGEKVPLKSSLLKKIGTEMPAITKQVATSAQSGRTIAVPTMQSMLQLGTVGHKVYKKVFTGEFALDKIAAAMKADGFDFEDQMKKVAKNATQKLTLWCLETCQKETRKTRLAANLIDYEKSIHPAAKWMHRLREAITDDAPISHRLKREYVELYVNETGKRFWAGVIEFLELFTKASATKANAKK